MLTQGYYVAAESIGQLQKDLDVARESQQYAESQLEAGHRVLQRHLEEKNHLKEENRQQAEQIESSNAQLAQAQGENQNLQRGMFGKYDFNIERYLL